MASPVRVLCLGNELLGDDAFGILVAQEIERLAPGQVEVVCTPESGFRLLDYVLGAERLLVVDTLQTGRAAPGTLHEIGEGDLASAPGGSPHFVGLFETLELARKLGFPAPSDVRILAVEPHDCLTVGGPMHPAVRAAIPKVVRWIRRAYFGGATRSSYKAGSVLRDNQEHLKLAAPGTVVEGAEPFTPAACLPTTLFPAGRSGPRLQDQPLDRGPGGQGGARRMHESGLIEDLLQKVESVVRDNGGRRAPARHPH